jgi:hypothetical protein
MTKDDAMERETTSLLSIILGIMSNELYLLVLTLSKQIVCNFHVKAMSLRLKLL